jgi:hypothetical protein
MEQEMSHYPTTSSFDGSHTHTLPVPDEIEAVARTLPDGAGDMMREMARLGYTITANDAVAGHAKWQKYRDEQQAMHMAEYRKALDKTHGEGYAASIRCLNT